MVETKKETNNQDTNKTSNTSKKVSSEPKKEKTTKGMTNLILEQIRSLIEINVALNTKVKELSGKLEESEKTMKHLNENVKSYDDRITKIEANMEKFIGLYEIVTNKYNPFLEDKEIFQEEDKNVYEEIDVNKLKEDAKKLIQDLKLHSKGNSSGIAEEDELESTLKKAKKEVPDVEFPEEKLGHKTNVTLDTFGGNKNNNDRNNKDNPSNEENNNKNEEENNAKNENIDEKNNTSQENNNSKNQNDEDNKNNKDNTNNDDLEKLSSKFHFVLKDGSLIKSIPELSEVLSEMDDETFSHHVNDSKNDFYEWIKHSIDKDFAEEIKDIKTKNELKEKLDAHISKFKK